MDTWGMLNPFFFSHQRAHLWIFDFDYLFFKLFCLGQWALAQAGLVVRKMILLWRHLCTWSYKNVSFAFMFWDICWGGQPGISNWAIFTEGVSVHEPCCASQWSIFSGEASSYNATFAASSWNKSMACSGFEIERFLLWSI